jgi:hypothetical protein
VEIAPDNSQSGLIFDCAGVWGTAFPQYDQSRMNGRLEKFDEVSRIRRDDGKVMIERRPPDKMIRSTRKTNVRYRLGIHADIR